jgi:hypothetical protein
MSIFFIKISNVILYINVWLPLINQFNYLKKNNNLFNKTHKLIILLKGKILLGKLITNNS